MASKISSCPMCTKSTEFTTSVNGQLNGSVLISKRKDKHFLTFFINTKKTDEEPAKNVGGSAYSINYCPWCGRDLNEETI